jgi:hypothetical protein
VRSIRSSEVVDSRLLPLGLAALATTPAESVTTKE